MQVRFQPPAYTSRQNTKKQDTSFGTAIQIEKAIIDGVETTDIGKIRRLAGALLDVLTKQKEIPNAKSIRSGIAKLTGDFKTPKRPIAPGENPIVNYHVDGDSKYFTTGLDALSVFNISANRALIERFPEAHTPSSLKRALNDNDKALQQVLTRPEAQCSKKLTLIGKSVPTDEFERLITKRETKPVLTGIELNA